MAEPEILSHRATYSRIRLEELIKRLNGRGETSQLEHLAIFCAGSYARLEASEYSDIDLFFVYGPSHIPADRSRTNEIKLFAAIIQIADDMGFPTFSNDGQYLATLTCKQVLEHLGSPLDDSMNLFTMRMLMLLESKCLVGEQNFSAVQREIISAYYRDYPDHQATFEPWFLINDIGRFWKTLLLNYEHKRNQPAEDELQKNKQKVKNFKLKYSRMTTCFATIAAVACLPKPPSEDQIFDLVQGTPQQRLATVSEQIPAVKEAVSRVLSEYAWFVEQTGQTEHQLRSGFEDKKHRADRFRRADAYGDAMYDLLTAIEEHTYQPSNKRLVRYLVI